MVDIFSDDEKKTNSLMNHASDPDPTPQPKAETTSINVKVMAPDGSEVHFKVKRTTRFERITNAYCERQSIPSRAVRFLFDGQRIQDTDTPESLGMEDNDVVDCVLQQTVCTSVMIYF